MTRRSVFRASPWFVALALAFTLCLALAVAALYPNADGSVVLTDNGTTVDASNASQGYVMVKHAPAKKTLKLRIVKGDSTYTYDLESDENYETFPLSFGSGDYKILVFQQVSGKRYTNDSSLSLSVQIADETLPYLYPNQYVWYTSNSKAVAKGAELCQGLSGTTKKVEAVRKYVASTITYDYALAATVKSGYLPSVDHVLTSGKGICFDYAVLTTCMLRSQGIPTKLVIGWADTIYHAWNYVLVDGSWQLIDTTADANHMNVGTYTEERIY